MPSTKKALLKAGHILAKHDRLYAVGKPIISDEAYDEIKKEYITLGGKDYVAMLPLGEIEHTRAMLSLKKAHSKEDIFAWVKHSREGTAFVLEPKVDGMAVCIEYLNGAAISMATRGDGKTGQTLSHLLPVFTKHNKEDDATGQYSFEAFVPTNLYELHLKDIYASPRNAVAGILNRKEPNKGLLNYVFLYPHEYTPIKGLLQTQKRLSIGVRKNIFSRAFEDNRRLLEKNVRVANLPMDGVVIKIAQLYLRETMGASSTYPRWARALKTRHPSGETTLKKVEWQVSRRGRLNPVGVLAPVTIEGAVVERVTLHNYAFIEQHKLTHDARVLIERSGEIIPKLSKVIEHGQSLIPPPLECPACGSTALQTPDGVFYCTWKEKCRRAAVQALVHACSRDALNYKGFGPAKAKQLIGIADTYDHPLLVLCETFSSPYITTLERFLYALGLPGIGKQKSRELARSVDGEIGELLDSGELDHLIEPDILEELETYFLFTEHKRISDELEGEIIVITGQFTGYSRPQIVRALEAKGALVRGTVSGKTTTLLVGDKPGSKLAKAEELGVRVLDAKETLALMEE